MTTLAQEESLRGLIRHFESRDDFGPERDLDHARAELARQPLFSQTRPFTRTVRPAGPGAAGDIQTPGQLAGAFVQNVPRAFGSLADETPTDVFNQIRFQAQLAESIAQDPDRNWFHEQFVRGVRAIPDMADQVAGAGHFVAKLNPAYWAMEWILPEERSIDAAVKRYRSAVSAGRALIHASLPVSQPGPDDWRVAGLNLFTFSGDVTQAGVAQAPQLAAGAAGAAMRGSAIAGSKLFALAGTGQTIGGRMTETTDYYEQAARDGRISPAMAEFGVMFESSIAGAVTYVSEKVVGKYIIDRIPGGDRLIAHSARNYLTNMVIGASGEAVQESIFDGVLTDTMVSLYRAGTSGDDEALKNLASIYTFDPEYWNSVLYEGLVAAPIGGGFGGAAVWSARRQQRMVDFQNALRFAQVLTDESAVRTDEHLSALTEQVIGRPQSEVDALVKMLRSDQFQGEVGSERAQRVKRLADMIEESAERWGHMARLSDEELEVAAAEGSDLTIDGVRIDRGEAQIEIMRRQAAQARQDAMESEARQQIIEAEQALDADETFTDENAESLIDEAEGPLTRYDATRARMKAAIPRVVEDMLSRPPGTPIDREALIATVQDVYALGRKKAEAVVRRAERVMEQERAAQDAMLGADEDITLTPDDEAALDRISTTIDVSVEAATSIRPQMRETGRTPPEATDEEAGEETQATRDEAATREATRQRIDQYLYRQPSGERLHIPGSETVIDISDAEGWWITPDLIGNPVMSYGDAIVFANVLRAEDASGQWQYAIRRNGDLTYTVVRRRATPEQQAAAQAARTPSTQTTAAPEAERSTGGSTAPAWRQSQVEFVDSFGGAFPAPLPDNLGEINPGINIRNGEQDFSGQRYRTREFIIGDPGGAPVAYVRMVAPKGMSSDTPMRVQMATIDPDVLPEVAERAKANLLTALSTSRKPVTSMVPARGIFDPGSAWLLHEMQVRQASATKRYDRAIEQGELTPEQVRAIFADYPRLPVPESAQERRDGDETETQDAGDEEAAGTPVGEEPDEAATLGVPDPRLAPFHGRFAPIVLARLEEALSPIPSALEEAQNRIEIRRNSASDDNLAGSLLNVGFAIEPDDLDGLSPIQQAAIRRRVRVSEDDGATLREVLGSALYEAAKREAIGGEAVRLQYKIDQALGARGGIDPEMVLAAFLLEARRRGRPETGKKRPSYDWVDPTKLPVGTTFTIFGQQVEIADEGDAEPDIQVLIDMIDTMLPASMIEAIPVDPGSLRLPDEGRPESPPSITPTQPGLLGEQFAGGITGSQRGMFQEGRSEIQAEEDAVNAEKQRRLDASEAGQLDLGDPASGTKSILGGTLKFTEDEVDRLGEIGDILGDNTTMFSGIPIDPKKWAALIEASAIIIRGGARAFTDFARTMFRSFGERIIPYLRQLYEAARRLPGVDSNTMDGEATVRSLTDADIERIARSEPSPEEIARGQKEAEARGGSAVNRDDAAQRGRADAGATRTGRARQRPELIVVDEPDIPEPQPFVTADTFGSATLDDVQVLGVNLALTRFITNRGRGFMLADGTGVGKTRQLLAIAHQFGKRTGKKVLLVTQNRAIIETRLIPDAALMGIDLSGIEFGTYNALADRKIGRGEYGLAIYDEAHQLKNTVSGRHNAAREVKSDHVLFSTATPLDRPTGAAYFMSEITGLPEQAIWRMLGFRVVEDIDRSGKKRRYAETEEGFSWAMILDNLISLRDRAIKQGAMLRREYPLFGDIATRTTVFPEGGVETQRQIDREWQRQIAAEPRNFSLHAQRILELGRWAETLKVQAAADIIESERKKGRQVVVAAEHHGVLTIRGLGGTKIQGVLETLNRTLEDRGVKVSRIYGGSTRGKIKAADDFQRGKTDVVLMTAASGGAGIDLDDQIGDRPRTLLILTPSFAGDVFDQVLGRVSRRNTRSPVKIVFLYNTQSIGDNHRQRVLKAKLDALYRIQRGADVDKALGFLKTSDTHDDTPDDDIGVDHDAQILGEQPKPQVPPGGPGGIENNYGGIPLVPLVAGTADRVSRNRTIQATVGFVVRDLIDRVRGLGGRAAEVGAHLGRRANSLDREVYGKLSGRIDEALVAVNGMGPKKAASIIRLMQGQRRTTKRGVKYEMARIVDAVEGRWTPTSPQDREAIEKIRAVIDGFGQEARDRGLIQKNFKDGKHQLFDHVPGGKVYARILTAEMIGVITGPDTQARNDIVDAIVHANGGKVSITDVLRHFNSIRKSWNDVGPEAAFSQVNAEFTREVPFMPSLVYTSGGAVPIFETQPYNFIQRYANHMSARLGYIGTFGQTVKGYHVVEPGTGRVLHFAATQVEADAWRSKNRPDGRLRRVKNLTQTITKRLVNEGRNIQPFIQMTRTLNAMPAIRMPVAPGEPTFKIRRAIAHLFDIFRIGMLSGRIIPNVGEPFGNTQSFVGLDDFTKAAWQLMTDYSGLVDSLEIDGAINANIINMGWDRNRPVTAAIRVLRESVDRLALGAKFYEEFQERWAAGAVKAMIERMRRGKGRDEDVGSIMAMMSWDIRKAERLKNGNGTAEEYLMLLRRGAAFLTAGNMRAAEASMFSQHPGTKITPNTRNWFVTTRYSDMKARSLVRLIESTAEIAREHDAALKRGDLKRAAEIARIHRAAYVKIARNVGGTTFAGVTGFLLNSLVVGGLLGLGIARAEFEDDTFEFLWESWLYAQFAGPYGSILRMMNSGTENYYEAIARGTMPGALFGEAYDMVARRGAYQNLNRMEGALRFASRFWSFGKISNAGYHAIAIYGFGADQTETSSFRLDTARRAFWRWFFEEGMTLNRSTAEIDEETRQFRQSMRQAYRAWTAGEDPWPYIDAALQVNEDADLESIRRSIRSRTILGDFNDDVYVPDRSEKRQQEIDARIQSLRDRIGDEAYDILKAHDNLLLGWADSFATPARRR